MMKLVHRWLYRRAQDILGEEEMASLKNDLVSPVKKAFKEAASEFIDDVSERYADDEDEE